MDLSVARRLSNGIIESITVQKQFDEEETQALHEQHSNQTLAVNKKQDQFKDLKKEWSDEIKDLKKEASGTLSNIAKGFEEQEVECCVVPNPESKEMDYVDNTTGEIHYRRKMTRKERQMHIQEEIVSQMRKLG
jgi:hypothetical protein